MNIFVRGVHLEGLKSRLQNSQHVKLNTIGSRTNTAQRTRSFYCFAIGCINVILSAFSLHGVSRFGDSCDVAPDGYVSDFLSTARISVVAEIVLHHQFWH